MRHATPKIVLALLLIGLATACATVAPGNDPVLVNAERSLDTATVTLDALFKLDYQNWQLIDPLLPGWKATVNNLRIVSPPILMAANQAIATYRGGLEALRVLQQETPLDPVAVQAQQEKLNQLATQLGQNINSVMTLVKSANDAISQWNQIKGGK